MISQVSVPGHVPADLVTFVDPIVESLCQPDPMAWFCDLARDRPVLYNAAADYPAWQGEWFFFGMEPLRKILENAELYSSSETVGIFEMAGAEGKLLPLEADPPEHGAFRSIIASALMPNRVSGLEGTIRAQTNDLIDAIIDTKSCEFNEAFANHLPIRVFMSLMGFPAEDRAKLVKLEHEILFSLDTDMRVNAAKEIYAYLHAFMLSKKAEPEDDLASTIACAKINGRDATEREIMGMYYLMFLAGLHTVTASLGLMFRCLADDPGMRERLLGDPALLNKAVDEFLRFNSIIIPARRVAQDHEFEGVQLKTGDVIRCVTVTASRDPSSFDAAQDLVLDRTPNRHLAFGAGRHLCAGFPLARLEMRVVLSTWLERIPQFRRSVGRDLSYHGIGGAFGLNELFLEWD